MEWHYTNEERKDQKWTRTCFSVNRTIFANSVLELRTREIDTVNDYERAVEWVRNNFRE